MNEWMNEWTINEGRKELRKEFEFSYSLNSSFSELAKLNQLFTWVSTKWFVPVPVSLIWPVNILQCVDCTFFNNTGPQVPLQPCSSSEYPKQLRDDDKK